MKTIRLSGKFSDNIMLVDDDIYERMVVLSPWHGVCKKQKLTYARKYIFPNGRWHPVIILAHRYAAQLYGLIDSHNKKIDSREIDHINHNTLDNTRINLRAVTTQENARNQVLRVTNKSGYKGVQQNKGNSKWIATIRDEGRKYLGSFDDKIEAAKAYDEAARKLGYLESSLNFPRINP